MSFAIALTDEKWELVADLFDPPGRRGAPALIPRRQMVKSALRHLLLPGRPATRWNSHRLRVHL